MNHCRISFFTQDEDLRGRLIASLDEAGFTAFEETDDTLLAFIPENVRGSIQLDQVLPEPLRWEETVIEPQNWNAMWEGSFEPVIVPGFCTVRAAFHAANTDTPHDIVITPKMSFGTGHHATTRMMIQGMRELDFVGTRVLDFGTGTGILAILAQQLGAIEVLALDNDDWSVENAQENVAMNDAVGVRVVAGSLEAAGSQQFDIILANINRHILLEYMPMMRALLKTGGSLLLSGIMKVDEAIISDSALASDLTKKEIRQEAEWIALRFEC